MLVSNRSTFDALLQLKDAGLVAASAAATVDGSAKVLDLGAELPDGADAPHTHGKLIVDVSAIEIASNDELFTILLEGSNKEDFSSGVVPLAALFLGAGEVIPGAGDTDSATGRYMIPWSNIHGDTTYRYVRLYTVVAGSVATGINFEAFIAKC